MAPKPLKAFRLGDVRGLYPKDLDENFTRRFARAFARHFELKGTVATGRDMRTSSASLQSALIEGFCEEGLEVVDVGLCPTELGYFSSAQPGIAAAVIVTASHNPARYNGLKCVLQNGEAVTLGSGLGGVKELMMTDLADDTVTGRPTTRHERDYYNDYLTFLKSKFDVETLQKGRIALNGLNGTAAILAGRIAEEFDLPVTWFRKEPGPIPTEGADPANPKLAAQMKGFMQQGDFTLGVAWDGDCDRCVFFDSRGDLVPTYYVIGLLAEHFLRKRPGSSIVFDTKLCWNTLDLVSANGGNAVPCRTGHAFMKQKMRECDAVYGGELSSHHFFGDFFYCDSGMIAWLTAMLLINESSCDIAELIVSRRKKFCSTPEINMKLRDVDRAFEETLAHYGPRAEAVEHFDGLSFEMPSDWRFTLRRSKTEPLVRLNFESRGEQQLLLDNAREILESLRPFQRDTTDPTERLFIQ